MADSIKNTSIKNSMKQTKERHSQMHCRVFEIKVDASKLSQEKKGHINQLFREAKWLRNAVVGSDDALTFDREPKSVLVKVGDEYEERDLRVLGSQMKQDIVDRVRSDVKALSTKKKKGEKVGALKYKSFCNSIPLRQYGTTYRIDFDNNTISIQKLSKPLKVRGLSQITSDMEIANAKFIRKPSGLYFHVVTYSEPVSREETGEAIGIDFGVRTNMTYSNGEGHDICVPETKAIKLASKRANKSYKRNGGKKTKNHYKRITGLRAAYEKNTNKKHDLANKQVHNILNDNDFVGIQDEMIANWHKGLFGRQVQHSAMGFIKGKLKTSSKVQAVPKEFPSTQKCPVCGEKTKHPLEKRDYDCACCGYHHQSRDIKSAEMILMEALNIHFAVGSTQQSPVEAGTSTGGSLGLSASCSPTKQEAHVL